MSQIEVSTVDGVTTIRFARAEKKNAFTREMYTAIVEALEHAEGDDAVRAVVLAGQPGVFAAGNDIADFLEAPPNGPDSPVGRFIAKLPTFEKPLVAAVDGPAIGVGTTMLFHCDLVVATERARFAMPFTALGLVPEAGASYLAPLIVGYQRAAEWLLLGTPFGPDEALQAGFVNKIVPHAELDAAVAAYTKALTARPPMAVRLSKKLLRAGHADAVAHAMEREMTIFSERLKSREAISAFQAFLKKA